MASVDPRPFQCAGALGAAVQLLSLAATIGIGLVVGPRPETAPFLVLRRNAFAAAAFASLGSVIAVTGAVAMETTFSLLHLAERYVSASGEPQRAALLAAAEAVVAGGLWNAIAGYLGGFLLQGARLAFSLLMLRSDRFHRVTAWSGLLGNGLDLAQHAIHPFLPEAAATIAMGMGLFYVVWLPLLARDFARLARAGRVPMGSPHAPARA